MVRHTLVVKPDVTNRELLDRAKEIAPEAVEGLSLRQFHGKYRLPIVRFELTPKRGSRNGSGPKAESTDAKPAARPAAEKAPPAPGRKRTRKTASGRPVVAIDGQVRDVLVQFAVELEQAESRSELVSVVAAVDDYVKRIVNVAADAYGRRRETATA